MCQPPPVFIHDQNCLCCLYVLQIALASLLTHQMALSAHVQDRMPMDKHALPNVILGSLGIPVVHHPHALMAPGSLSVASVYPLHQASDP